MKKATTYIIAFSIFAGAGICWWLFCSYLDFQKPELSIQTELRTIGRQKTVGVRFADGISGLRHAEVTIVQGGKSVLLQSIQFPRRGLKEKTLSFVIDPYALKLENGAATLSVSATDYSLLKNQASLSRYVQIDMTPPQIYPLNPVNNINAGGTGVTTFRTSKPIEASVVWVGDTFTRGYPIVISGKPCTIVYFALPPAAQKGQTNIRIAVRDESGNEASNALPCVIKSKKFRNDTMELTDAFLQEKMTDFQILDPGLRGKNPLDTFIAVNGAIREGNTKTIQSVCEKSAPIQLWRDTFLRMKNASPMASFGDRRTYLYGGKPVGESIHWGVDLASTAQAPVEAANDGVVAFVGQIGIYGNTIIIDHGYGLFSLYAHLSSIGVKSGQAVKKEEVIGQTGSSGLAGGDHLHFAIIAGGQFVNPQEWWDPHWIKDNVNTKLTATF